MTLRTKNIALCTLLVALTAALRLWYMGAADIGNDIARSTGFSNLYSMTCCFTNAPVPTVLPLALQLVATVVAIVKIVKHRYTPGVAVMLAALWAIPLIVSFALSFIRGMFLNRYFYFTLPTYYLCIVACIAGITRRLRFANIATMVAVAVLMLQHLGYTPTSTEQHTQHTLTTYCRNIHTNNL